MPQQRHISELTVHAVFDVGDDRQDITTTQHVYHSIDQCLLEFKLIGKKTYKNLVLTQEPYITEMFHFLDQN